MELISQEIVKSEPINYIEVNLGVSLGNGAYQTSNTVPPPLAGFEPPDDE